jgi:hypothetical protein
LCNYIIWSAAKQTAPAQGLDFFLVDCLRTAGPKELNKELIVIRINEWSCHRNPIKGMFGNVAAAVFLKSLIFLIKI